MTVAALFMGFIITGAFISMSYAGDATYSQDSLITFVWLAMVSFANATLAFGVSMIMSLLGQQCYSTKSCIFDAVLCFKGWGFALIFAEMLLYSCGLLMMESIGEFLQINYISPSTFLCPGSDNEKLYGLEYLHRGDTFCAQLGNDLFDAAKGLKECNDTWKLDNSTHSMAEAARKFNLGAGAKEKDRKLAICNQLDWYVWENWNEHFENKEEAKVWFGWDAFMDRTKGWEGQPANVEKHTAVWNNGKILGEEMCHKGSASTKMTRLCNKKAEGYKESDCSLAQRNYAQADECAGQKFNDVVKCFHTCSWSGGRPIKMSFQSAMNALFRIRIAISTWMSIRLLIWFVYYLFSLKDVCSWLCGCEKSKSYYTEPYHGLPEAREVEISVEEMIVKKMKEKTTRRELDTGDDLVGPGILVEPLIPAAVPMLSRAAVSPPTSMSKIGVDLNHDGRPDMYYMGVDNNRDGIPDALQGASGLFSSGVGTTVTPPFSSAARVI